MYFEEDRVYHIFNRGINGQQIFFTSRNYEYFLSKIDTEISPWVDILAYCLMPNHFHLLIRAKKSACAYYQDKKSSPNPMQILCKKLGVTLGSYTQGINKHYGRTGSLWQQKTKSIELNKFADASEYLESCFHYIHQNPTRAGLVKKVNEWPYSSYSEFLRNTSQNICDIDIALSMLNKTPLEFLISSKIVKEKHDLKRFLYYNSQP